MSENRFIHLGAFGGRITVCYQFDQEKGADQRSVTASFAWCNPNDQFRKVLGRLKSSKKHEAGSTHVIQLVDGYTITQCVQNFIMQNVDLQKMSIVNKADLSSFVPKWFQLAFFQNEADTQMQQLVMAGMKASGLQAGGCSHGGCDDEGCSSEGCS